MVDQPLTAQQQSDAQMAENEAIMAQSLVQPKAPDPQEEVMFVKLLDNESLIDYFERKLKGEVWSMKENDYVRKYTPLLKEAGINGVLALLHPISDKHSSTTYYDEEEINEIMYHMLFELDEFMMEKWQEIGLVENPKLPLVRVGNGHYQLRPKYPNVPIDKDQEYYLTNLNKYDIVIPSPNLAHYNLVRGIIRRVAYATLKKSFRGLTLKQLKTNVNVLEQTRTDPRRSGGKLDALKNNPLFR